MDHYRSLGEAADHIISVIREFIAVNTIFIATNEGGSNTILRSYNRDEVLVEEGSIIPLLQSYCNLVFSGASSVIIIPDTSTNSLTSHMNITRVLGPCSFIGVPIATQNNESYGTICAMDRNKQNYSEKEIKLLEAMGGLLGYVAELEDMAIRDGLTKLFNRKYLEQYNAARRNGMGHHIALLFIDIDDFKNINDTYGHEAGDSVLKIVAARLKKQSGNSDTIIRMGGDEFVVITESTLEEEIRLLAENILSIMKEPIHIGDFTIRLSISIGISTETDEVLSISQLVRKADHAMYEVKNQGKANYKISL